MRATEPIRDWLDDPSPLRQAALSAARKECDTLDAKFDALVEACEAVVAAWDSDKPFEVAIGDAIPNLRAALRAAKETR